MSNTYIILFAFDPQDVSFMMRDYLGQRKRVYHHILLSKNQITRSYSSSKMLSKKLKIGRKSESIGDRKTNFGLLQ